MKRFVALFLVVLTLMSFIGCAGVNQKTLLDLPEGVYISKLVTKTVSNSNTNFNESYYDSEGNVVCQKGGSDDNITNINYSYDDTGRINAINYNDNGRIGDITFKYNERKLTGPLWDTIYYDEAFNNYDFPDTVWEAFPITTDGKEWTKEYGLEYWQYVYNEQDQLIAICDPLNPGIYHTYFSNGKIKSTTTFSGTHGMLEEFDEQGYMIYQKTFISETGETLSETKNTFEEGKLIFTESVNRDYSSETGFGDTRLSRYENTYENGVIKSQKTTFDDAITEYKFELSKEENGIKTYIAKDSNGKTVTSEVYDEMNRILSQQYYEDGVPSLEYKFSYYKDTMVYQKNETIIYQDGEVYITATTEKTFEEK